MGLVNSSGIKSGHQVEKNCESCQTVFMGWSDDTVTIKGRMPQQKLCPDCYKIEMYKNLPSIEEAFKNMKNQ